MQKYPANKEGLQKLIADKGGEAFVNSAVDFAGKAPKVRALFNRFGVNPETLKNSMMRDLQSDVTDVEYRTVNPAEGFKDRLNKLR